MKNLLIYLDTDAQPSAFDQVVAHDAGADAVLAYGSVTPENCFPLVEGAIYTRAPKHKHHTAILVGGSNLDHAQAVEDAVRGQFFADFRVSVGLDANGCNTTAAAAVATLGGAHPLKGSRVVVLAGTGPVGQRAALLFAQAGAKVYLSSRKLERAEQACDAIEHRFGASVFPVAASTADSTADAIEGAAVVLATGQTGVQLLPGTVRVNSSALRVVGDAGTCPPLGVEGLQLQDKGREDEGVLLYGGLTIGALKLHTQREMIARLFARNDQFWDAPEIFALAQTLYNA